MFGSFEKENNKQLSVLDKNTEALMHEIKQQVLKTFDQSEELTPEELLAELYDYEFEQHLAKLWKQLIEESIPKSTVFISYAWGNLKQQSWIHRLAGHLQGAKINSPEQKPGITVLIDVQNNPTNSVTRFTENISTVDKVLLIGTKTLVAKWKNPDNKVAPLEIMAISTRMRGNYSNHGVIKLLLEGEYAEAFPDFMRDFPVSETDFRLEQDYYKNFFSLLSSIYIKNLQAISLITKIQEALEAVFNDLAQLSKEDLLKRLENVKGKYKISNLLNTNENQPPSSLQALNNDNQLSAVSVQSVKSLIEEKIISMHERILVEELAYQEQLPEFSVYIPPLGSRTPLSQERLSFSLGEAVDTFTQSDKKTLLLLGEAGAGKSFFLQKTAIDYCKAVQQAKEIVLYLHLPSLADGSTNLIADLLNKYEFTKDEISLLQREYKFLIFLDAYDERNIIDNIYLKHKMFEWDLKVIITCRNTFLTTVNNYAAYFMPFVNQQPIANWYDEIQVMPFSEAQINQYIEKYVATYSKKISNDLQSRKDVGEWLQSQSYINLINQIPGLGGLINNPWLLSITVAILPHLALDYAEKAANSLSIVITKRKLIDLYIRKHFEREQSKLIAQNFRCEKNLIQNFETFARRLAVAMKEDNIGQVYYENPSDLFDEPVTNKYDKFFNNKNPKVEQALKACPLKEIREKDKRVYAFSHINFLDYFASSQNDSELANNNAAKLEQPTNMFFQSISLSASSNLQSEIHSLQSKAYTMKATLINPNILIITVQNKPNQLVPGCELSALQESIAKLCGQTISITASEGTLLLQSNEKALLESLEKLVTSNDSNELARVQAYTMRN
jgi:hypothetical protein